jgi:hypothetical protein
MEDIRGARLISIIGMHRSGTSALAGALHKLGADLGPSSSWIQPAIDNPRGFFEYAPVLGLNRDLLAAFGGTWSSPPPLPRGWTKDERIADLSEETERLAAEIPENMVVKDPRLSLLQPLWGDVGTVLGSVLCLRHPDAVARSLLERNQFKIDHGLFLWFRYNAAARLNCPDALVVEYEELLTDPAPQLSRIAEHISLEVSAKTVEAAARTVYRSMAHHRGTSMPDSPIGVMCQQLYDLLRSEESLETNRIVWTWGRLVNELPWAGPEERDIRRAQGKAAALSSQIDQLKTENQRLTTRLQRLETELRDALKTADVVSMSDSADFLGSQ